MSVAPRPGWELRPMITIAPDRFLYTQLSTLTPLGASEAGCLLTSWPIRPLTSSAVARSQAVLVTWVAGADRVGVGEVGPVDLSPPCPPHAAAASAAAPTAASTCLRHGGMELISDSPSAWPSHAD